jgi:hypothetical protein
MFWANPEGKTIKFGINDQSGNRQLFCPFRYLDRIKIASLPKI